MYVTLRLDDNGCCRIHSISDGNEEIVTNERYVVMPWKMVTRHGVNMILKEAVDRILNQKECENKEFERRNREREETKKKCKEYYEAQMKEETERLNKLVDWYKFKLNEIREAPVDRRPRKLEKLYQHSGKNKDLGVTITKFGTLNPVDYPGCLLKLELPEDNEEIVFYDAPTASSLPAGYKPYSQLDYFKKLIKAYNGYDSDAVKYVKKVKALVDKPLDELELGHVRLAMKKVKCPHKLDISVFYQLTRRLFHEELEYDNERIITHLYDTFCNESIKLLGKMVRCRTNVLYHLQTKIGMEPNADLFQFMKGASHKRTEEEIKFVFEHLGWNYSPIQLD